MDDDSTLNAEELHQVTVDSLNPKYKNPQLLNFCRHKTDISRVSEANDLILINGNKKTGLVHINNRHNRIYNVPFWNKSKDKDNYKLDNPSKFSSSNSTYFDYIKIADELYGQKSSCKSNSTKTKYYDVYEGNVCSKHSGSIPYRLVLYKNTKVIHTLYPTSNKFTPDRIINFHKSFASLSMNFGNSISTIEIPYSNHNGTNIYKAIFQFNCVNKTEKLYIQRNLFDGIPFITHYIGVRVIKVEEYSPFIMMQYQYEDLLFVETMIMKIDNQSL